MNLLTIIAQDQDNNNWKLRHMKMAEGSVSDHSTTQKQTQNSGNWETNYPISE